MYAWSSTAWGANWLDPDRLPVRLLLVGLMFASLLMVIFAREAVGHVPRSRPLGLAALAILAVATSPLTLIVSIAASTAVLVAVAIADTVRAGDQAPASST